MDSVHFKIPLNLKGMFEGRHQPLGRCTLLESIDQNLELILTTCPGEHSFNPEFGCGTWDMDFERVVSRSQWEETFSGHVLSAVEANEKRISNAHVTIKMDDVLWDDVVSGSTTMRKKVDIVILADLVETGQKCGFKYVVYMGPMSSE